MPHLLTAGAAIASMLALPAPLAASEYPTDQIAVEVVTVNGSGCPAGTAKVTANADNTAFTVTYSDYVAQTGAGASLTDFRKNCQLSIRLVAPAGFTYAIAKAEYQGFAHLAPGATGAEIANYYFQGSSANSPVSHTFVGPYNDTWRTTDVGSLTDQDYAPCGAQRNLNINTELRVSAGSSDSAGGGSFMSMDTTDASVHTVYHLAWTRCS
jgi:hypothetical protein